MARNFVATNRIQCSLGNCGITGAITLAAILRKTSDAASNGAIIDIGAGDNWEFFIGSNGSGNKLSLWNGIRSSGATAPTVTAADGWVLVAVTKPAGTVVARMHKYIYSTGVWSHADTAVAQENASAPATSVALGSDNGTSTDDFLGDMAIVGAWGSVLTDDQVESLAYSQLNWFSQAPRAIWPLDQSATTQKVVDYAGGGANESSITGTSVSTSSVPIFTSAPTEAYMGSRVVVAGAATHVGPFTMTFPIVADIVAEWGEASGSVLTSLLRRRRRMRQGGRSW